MKILVTGGSGLVGNGIKNIESGYNYEFVYLKSSDCNLLNYIDTLNKFKTEKPDCIIHLAAIVGGLFKNMNNKIDMFEGNLIINYNVLKAAHEANINKVVSCLSTCIFPDITTYPINEKMLHNGPPHHSNDAYAYAKRMLDIHSKIYNEQFGRNYVCIIPTNVYGNYDNYNLENAHIIPALIHKCFLAKQNNEKFIVRGSGKPLRQFIYSNDLARLILWVVSYYNDKESIILSVDENDEVSIATVAKIIARTYNYEHMMDFDTNFSDGQYKKTADNSKLKKMYYDTIGENFKFTSLESGIQESVNWFINNYNNCRK